MAGKDDLQETLQTYIRSRRLFVLGAGFSVAAGVPMIGSLFAGAMERFCTECTDLFERVDNYVRICFRLNGKPNYHLLSLSEVCTFLHYTELREHGGSERWSDMGSRENLALRYFLAKEIALRTPAIDAVPELYLQFATQLQPGDIVISFNWDTLLEVALEAAGKPYTYRISRDRVSIFKPHGSINWRLGLPGRNATNWCSMEFTKDGMPEEVYFNGDFIHSRHWRCMSGPLGEVQPFIVLPGFGKAFDVRRLAPLWFMPELMFALTHDIFIIGLSLSRDDFIIRSFLQYTLPYAEEYSGVSGRRIIIINPDPLVRDNFGFLVGDRHIDFRCEKFESGHLDLMDPSVSHGPAG